jgi:hypothetical protein
MARFEHGAMVIDFLAVPAIADTEQEDSWRQELTDTAVMNPADIRAATAIIRRLDLNIRAPDTITMRLGAPIATFDRRMADNARTLGILVAAA